MRKAIFPSMYEMTRAQVRIALLRHQCLWPPRAHKGDADAKFYFDRVGSIQFDPVDVAGNSPEISLGARLRSFRSADLSRWLYKERWLCDLWDKNACIAPTADHADLLSNRVARDGGWRERAGGSRPIDVALHEVRELLAAQGPLENSSFRDPLMREALEQMLLHGEVCIHHRQGRRRYFDLSANAHPELLIAPPDRTEQELTDYHILRRIGGIGLLWNRGSDAFLGLNLRAPARERSFRRLEQSGQITPIRVQGMLAPLYARTQDLEHLLLQEEAPKPRAALLGPLDNLLWDRKLIQTFFDFAYKWEIYTPANKRKYASYTIPLLYGDRFVARMQLRRENGVLTVERMWAEDGLRLTRALTAAMDVALRAHAHMLGLKFAD